MISFLFCFSIVAFSTCLLLDSSENRSSMDDFSSECVGLGLLFLIPSWNTGFIFIVAGILTFFIEHGEEIYKKSREDPENRNMIT